MSYCCKKLITKYISVFDSSMETKDTYGNTTTQNEIQRQDPAQAPFIQLAAVVILTRVTLHTVYLHIGRLGPTLNSRSAT